MIRETRTASIPDIREDNVLEVLRAVKSTLEVREGRLGDRLDKAATLRDLIALNVASDGNGGFTTSGSSSLPVLPTNPRSADGYNPATDYTSPPAPLGVTATGGFTNVYLEWNGAPYRNHAYAEIWRASVNNIGAAVLVGTTSSSVYADPADAGFTYYYWVRFVSKANVTGPYSASSVSATTVIDVSSAYDEIYAATVANGTYSSPVPFIFLPAPATYNGITYPAGTWIKDSFIANATIGSAKIKDLTADKITAGSLTASIGISTGQIYGGVTPGGIYPPGHPFFGTGFYLGNNGGTYKFFIGSPDQNVLWDGTSLSVKGTVYASAGSIGGINLAASSVYTTNYVAGSGSNSTVGFKLRSDGVIEVSSIISGAYTGPSWPTSGSGFFLGAEGLLMGRPNSGRYLQITSSGDFYAPGISIVNGNATFSGALSAASGTFSGTLSANTYLLQSSGGIAQGAVFVDPAQTSTVLNSTVTGAFSYSGNTTFNNGEANAVITSSNTAFYCSNGYASRYQSVRTGTHRFMVFATGTVDAFLTIWYRKAAIANLATTGWTFIAQASDSQVDYGATSVVGLVTVDMYLGEAIQFGMAPFGTINGTYNGAYYFNGNKRELRDSHMMVIAVNF